MDAFVTAVLVESAEPSDLIVAGSSVADQRIGTFYVEVSITEHTNIKDEDDRVGPARL
jgi:4-oxalocrotonate tautomerase